MTGVKEAEGLTDASGLRVEHWKAEIKQRPYFLGGKFISFKWGIAHRVLIICLMGLGDFISMENCFCCCHFH